jgi:2,4-dienoyl-CoA reductase-like NADH-dependent reductase (Old Yellow Enzyme family)
MPRERFPRLISPVSLGSLALKNRLVRSATYEAKATEDGRPTPGYIDFYRRLAAGGVGLIITGFDYPQKDGKLPRSISVEDDGCLKSLPNVPAAVHGLHNGCKIALQIGHCGRQVPLRVARKPVAPSPIREPFTNRMPRELSLKEIEIFMDACAAAIGRAKKAGFDAVQIHAAHGWLLSSFLSPHTNHRTDIFGGNTENRARIMTEIIKRARGRVGDDYPILAKMNARDYVENGIEVPESLALGKIFEDAGYAALEISSAMWETATRKPEEIGWKAERIPEARRRIHSVADEAYHREFTRLFKQNMKRARIILVGGMRTPELMEELLAKGDADLISLSRPLIREPDLPQRWFSGSNQKSACISCSSCLETLIEEEGLRCPLVSKKGIPENQASIQP